MRGGKGDEEVELGPVLFQLPEGGPCDESSQRESYEVDGSEVVERIVDVPDDFIGSLASQVFNRLVHFVGD